jgi:hypothetical protein
MLVSAASVSEAIFIKNDRLKKTDGSVTKSKTNECHQCYSQCSRADAEGACMDSLKSTAQSKRRTNNMPRAPAWIR